MCVYVCRQAPVEFYHGEGGRDIIGGGSRRLSGWDSSDHLFASWMENKHGAEIKYVEADSFSPDASCFFLRVCLGTKASSEARSSRVFQSGYGEHFTITTLSQWVQGTKKHTAVLKVNRHYHNYIQIQYVH